ncbi:MAG TPA: protein-glutamate O-methyltransferase CheR [Spongiibacteraceae bacterium]|jgi:chemotaxis methyl-accepting protein methylase
METWLQPALPAMTDQQFADWQQLIETRTGIDFSQHRPILQGGLTRRLRQLDQGANYDAYFDQVTRWPDGLAEWQLLLDHIAVKETSFFRQPAAFELVRNYLRKRVANAQTLDLWSVGCATGEEAYGLAMVASDIIERIEPRCFLGVLATDLCSAALQQARDGCFRAKRLEQIPDALRRRFFVTENEQFYRASPRLQRRMCFAQTNLLDIEHLPSMPMDVIFCQNVLVYFRRWRTKQVLDALVDRLKPGGLLVVGPGEAAHWQHAALVRTAHQGVTAWLRRIDTQSPKPQDSWKNPRAHSSSHETVKITQGRGL